MTHKNGLLSRVQETDASSLDLPEAHNWPSAAFRTLDVLTRCPICGDHFRAPMSLACAHTFCSACIRRAFSYRSECPECRTAGSVSQMRKNRLVEDITVAWQQARLEVLHWTLQTQREADLGHETPDTARLKTVATSAVGTTPRASSSRTITARARSLSTPLAVASVDPDVARPVSTSVPSLRTVDRAACLEPDVRSVPDAVSFSQGHTLGERALLETAADAVHRPGSERSAATLSSSRSMDERGLDSNSDHGWPGASIAPHPVPNARPTASTTETDTESSSVSDAASFRRRTGCEKTHQKQRSRHIVCPICNHPYPQAFIQAHVDECLDRVDAQSVDNPRSVERQLSKKHTSRSGSEYPLGKIHEVWYDGQSERRLRAMIQSLGVNIPPPWYRHRQGLIYIHREYVIRHNAECDVEPITERKKLRQICREVEELAWSQIQIAPSTTRSAEEEIPGLT
ncbi:hypothetical protein CCYA_CCYA18G4519 [Cyanidiococcus yangmingshanensis]|nr:hypothetical protein CCYA_CCYA18G4519 [Cyanidiococcus yangmingshanensis]